MGFPTVLVFFFFFSFHHKNREAHAHTHTHAGEGVALERILAKPPSVETEERSVAVNCRFNTGRRCVVGAFMTASSLVPFPSLLPPH